MNLLLIFVISFIVVVLFETFKFVLKKVRTLIIMKKEQKKLERLMQLKDIWGDSQW